MVRAILDGRKTVTRRVVKPHISSEYKYKLGYVVDSTDKKNEGRYAFGTNEYGGSIQYAKPPYKVNDILYVRETYRWLPCFDCGRDMWEIPCKEGKFNHKYNNTGCYVYKADIPNASADFFNWKPSIHMPKEAARIFLRVTDVRVEKLRDMELEDFFDEGIQLSPVVLRGSNQILTGSERERAIECREMLQAREKFRDLWDTTAGKPHTPERYANSWNGNPYVWVIEFEVITAEQARGN